MPKRKQKKDKRKGISGTIEPELYAWLEKKIGEDKFYNMSDALSKSIKLLKKSGE